MRGRGFITALAALAGSLTLIPATATAAPPSVAAGARFDGVGASKVRSFVTLNRAGSRLAAYDVTVLAPCNDGKSRPTRFISQGEKPTAVAADGSFSFDSGKVPFSMREKVKRPVPGRTRTTFSGQVIDANSISITVADTFTSKTLKCGGSNTFTLYRDGTPQAPFRNADMATGSYRVSGRKLRIPSLRVVAPGRYVSALKYALNVPCRGGYSYDESGGYFPFDLNRARETAYRVTDQDSRRIERGVTAASTTVLTIRFFRRGGVYRVTGRIRTKAVVRRNGKRVRCSASRPFTGRFVSGPG